MRSLRTSRMSNLKSHFFCPGGGPKIIVLVTQAKHTDKTRPSPVLVKVHVKKANKEEMGAELERLRSTSAAVPLSQRPSPNLPLAPRLGPIKVLIRVPASSGCLPARSEKDLAHFGSILEPTSGRTVVSHYEPQWPKTLGIIAPSPSSAGSHTPPTPHALRAPHSDPQPPQRVRHRQRHRGAPKTPTLISESYLPHFCVNPETAHRARRQNETTSHDIRV